VSSTLERYEQQHAELVGKRSDLEALIAASPQKEAVARAESLSRGVLPGATSGAVRERRRREDAERQLDSVSANLASLEGLLEQERAAEQERRREAFQRELVSKQDAVRDAWRQLGDVVMGAAYDTWLSVCERVRELEAWAEAAPGLLPDTDNDLWRFNTANLVIEPHPRTFVETIHDLYAVSTDAGQHEYFEGRERFDYNGELRHLVRDRRGADGVLRLLRARDTRDRSF
jgi:hypothetical protein